MSELRQATQSEQQLELTFMEGNGGEAAKDSTQGTLAPTAATNSDNPVKLVAGCIVACVR